MRVVRFAFLAVLFALAGCGGTAPPPPEPADPGLESSWRLARFALRNGESGQAVQLYERVLARAYARDDATVIGDVGYEYALALLRDGKPAAAAAQAVQVRDELVRRDAPPFAELYLVEAVARYQNGDAAAARTSAEEAIGRARPDDEATRGRAWFILGMIAADAADRVGIDNAIGAIGSPVSDALVADAAELRGRRALLRDAPGEAMGAFETSATLRRDLRDYSGMARALAAAGGAAEAAGAATRAADFYYRAGRSADIEKDRANAQRWLAKALALAETHGLDTVAADARSRLDSLAP